MKILNFGSLNIDFVYSVDHILKSGETLASDNLELFPGGKGLNQSVALAKAGADVYHAGMIGSDGVMLKDTLVKSGVKVDFLRECAQKTGHAIIQVDKEANNNILLFGGANKMIDKAFVDVVLSHFSSEDILLLQNEINEIAYIMEKAYEKEMRIVFNPSPIDEALAKLPLEKVSWFILNEIEGMCLTKDNIPEGMADKLLNKYPDAHIVLTLGGDGVIFKDKQEECRQSIYRVKAVDTTAAGDTFTGYFLTSMVKGLPAAECLDKAAKAAAIAVSRKGASTSIPTADEVEKTVIYIAER